VGSAERFGVQHEIGKAGQHDCLGVNIATLIVKVIILRTLQEEANPASPAMLQDGTRCSRIRAIIFWRFCSFWIKVVIVISLLFDTIPDHSPV
jgi:hypothetical protein